MSSALMKNQSDHQWCSLCRSTMHDTRFCRKKPNKDHKQQQKSSSHFKNSTYDNGFCQHLRKMAIACTSNNRDDVRSTENHFTFIVALMSMTSEYDYQVNNLLEIEAMVHNICDKKFMKFVF